MLKTQIGPINQTIQRTKKAIVALGCSFVQGVGAVDSALFEKYGKYIINKTNKVLDYNSLPYEQKKELVREFRDVTLGVDGIINMMPHEYKRSFVSVLCDNYLDAEYAPINLGRSGNGNRATIKDLYFYPDIFWDDLEEIIVIFCPTGPERFDFINDSASSHTLNDHQRWVTIWPSASLFQMPGPRKDFSKTYLEAVYSPKFEIMEQIANIQELLLWCKHKNAKLIITPAFTRNKYTRSDFEGGLRNLITRTSEQELITTVTDFTTEMTNQVLREKKIKEIKNVVEMWPWENMFLPGGTPTFADLLLSQEFSNYDSVNFYSFIGKGSPEGWFTPCAHPSAKGHDLFAQHLFKHITENL